MFNFAPKRQVGPAGPRGWRAYAVGDVHGRLDLLDQLLDKIHEDLNRRPAKKVLLVFSDPQCGPCDQAAPQLEGHLFNYVGEPNRYGLPAFYELHVWAWENNPKGTFADWNTRVSCDRQPSA